MSQSLLRPDDDAITWRENWKATIRQQARQYVPVWLQEMRREHLGKAPETAPASLSSPITPIPGANETGPIPVETAIIPMVKLLPPIGIRDTRELVSSAVHWFYQRHGCLPTAASLNPLRCLALSQAFFPIDCEEIGGYTIEIQQAACLGIDEVWLSCLGLEDRYLCIPCLANSW